MLLFARWLAARGGAGRSRESVTCVIMGQSAFNWHKDLYRPNCELEAKAFALLLLLDLPGQTDHASQLLDSVPWWLILSV